MATGVLTNRTFLMKGTGTSTVTYQKLVDIIDFPDLGQAPESIDITTLSDMARHKMLGIQENDVMNFTALYTAENYTTVNTLVGTETQFAVWFGGSSASVPTGDKGKFSFKGMVNVYVNGGGINEATQMTITIAPTSDVTFSAGQ